MSTLIKQGLTNHVTLVLDRSGSMGGKEEAVIKAVDAQIASLAEMSVKMDQETRVTVVIFDDVVDVLVYDKDVLRLPSIAEYYEPRGMTALVDATLKSIEDLEKIPELYSDHAFLLFVVTDGMENRSQNTPSTLSRKMHSLGDNWSVAALVPDMRGEQYALKCGFPGGSILQWDTTTTAGFEKAASQIKAATDNFMQSRASGVRGTRSVFSMDAQTLNSQTVSRAQLKEVPPEHFQLVRVAPKEPEQYPKINEWVPGATGHRFRTGMVYQELVKSTEVQATKKIIVVHNKTDRAYTGTQDQMRSLLGIGDNNEKISPDYNKDYSVFIESKSTNRKPVVGQRMLLMLG